MQYDIAELQPSRASYNFIDDSVAIANPEEETNTALDSQELIWFHSHFEDCMEMFADMDTVAEYLSQHSGWFCRCALPMKTEPLGNNAYDLLIGRFGAFGYQVEARIGLELVPPDAEGVYRIRTVPVPNYTAPGYEVDFQSTMTLVELPTAEFCAERGIKLSECPTQITGAQWHLDLAVGVQFPKFILSKSRSLIQKTGDTLLKNIVKQVSRRLSAKTQQDFHSTLGIPFPKKRL
jgi:Protein of unknown function (DUF1997)